MSSSRSRAPSAVHVPELRKRREPVDRSPASDRVAQQAGTPLPPDLRRQVEARFGTDFSDVRLHTDAQAADAAHEQRAKAYTVGNHIVFAGGHYAPDGGDGRRLLAHELAHVVQQRRGGEAPALDPSAAHESAADTAAAQFAAGQENVAVAGSTGVGIAREPDPAVATEEEIEEKRRRGQASSTVLSQRTPAAGTPEPMVEVVSDPNKGRGTRAEVTLPFERYSGSEWNHLGGGSETASSRPSLARRSSRDKAAKRMEGTAGVDSLVEHVQTQWLAIGEQKATSKGEFVKATAITTNLQKNLEHSIGVLRQQIDDGKVHPDALPGLQRTIARLDATLKVLRSPSNDARLPAGVVFELTNLGGKGKSIGREHLRLLEKSYGAHPEFLKHLLERTYVRDPALARERNRPLEGRRGTETDPDIVPAMDLLSEGARDDLRRLESGKSRKEWAKQKAQEKKARQAEVRRQRAQKKKDAEKARAERRKVLNAQRAAAKRRLNADADRVAAKARKKHLDDLRAKRKTDGEAPPTTKKARQADQTAANKVARGERKKFLVEHKQRERDAAKARKDAERKARNERQRAEAERRARTKAEKAKAKADHKAQQRAVNEALKRVEAIPDLNPESWAKLPAADRQLLERAASRDPKLAARLNRKVNAKQTAEFEASAKRRNAASEKQNRRRSRQQNMGRAAHAMNQAAGGIRAFDAFEDARKEGKGYAEASFEAGKTYLENTNQLLGAYATYESRTQKETLPDGRQQQYYGEDAGDAFFGTLGENIAGFIVPGSGVDQLVNAGANLFDATDDHFKRGDAKAANKGPSTPRSAVDLAAEMTPSRMFAQTIGAGMRSYYDIGKAIGGQTSGVDKFADDAVRGKLGAVIQPWAMAADFIGELGGSDASTALDKTLKKSKDTTLVRLGDASGDAMYELGQNADAKAGKYGGAVQSLSTALGVTSDLIAGRSFDQAIDSAAAQGSTDAKAVAAVRDTYRAGKEKASEIWNEDIPAAKRQAEETIDRTVEKAKAVIDDPGKAARSAWNRLKSLTD